MRISFLSNWIKRWRIWYYKRLDSWDVYDLSEPLGRRGEQYAARYLQTKGYEIVRKNWKNGQYELDIIAQDGDVLVFVEVKTRSDDDINPPERNVNGEKQRRIVKAAESFIKMYMNLLGLKEYRFDVVGIIWRHGEKRPEIVRHWEDCVDPQDYSSSSPRRKRSRRSDDPFTVRF